MFDSDEHDNGAGSGGWDDHGFAAGIDPYRHIWVAVLAQAVRDVKLNSCRADVIAWIRTSDFRRVCEFASVDVDAATSAFRRLINEVTGSARPYKPVPSLAPPKPKKPSSHQVLEENEITFQLLNEGYSQRAIASAIGISPAALNTRLQTYKRSQQCQQAA